jgi:hypothetical protein
MWPFSEHVTMRTTVSSTVIVLSVLFATAASAAGSSGSSPAGSRHGEWRQKIFDQIDTNHDGAISRAEYQAWVDGRFAGLDTNGDGVINADEVATSPAAAERVRKRAEHFVRRYDSSGSGHVSKADFEAKEMQRFDRLGNGADSITADEFAAAHPFKHRRAPQPDAGG